MSNKSVSVGPVKCSESSTNSRSNKLSDCKFGCILQCCNSCSFCSFTWASTKERSKSRSISEQNKACQMCLLCKSMSFCPLCHKCAQCCLRTKCRRQTTEVLASLAGFGCKSSSSLNSQGGLHPPFQTKAPFDKVPFDSKWLCKSKEKLCPQRSTRFSYGKVGSRKGDCQVVTGLLQPPFLGSQTQIEMETNVGSKLFEPLFKDRYLQNGNPGVHPVVPKTGGVDHLARLQRRLLPHPYCTKVKKISQGLPFSKDLPVHSPALRAGHSSSRVHKGGQGSETHGSGEGYQNPPVSRRLVTESPFPGNLPTTYPDPLGPMSAVRLGSKYDQVRASSHSGLQFCRLPVRPDHRSSSPHSRKVDSPSGKVKVHEKPSPMHGLSVHVLDRPFDCNRETGNCWLSSHETHSVAPEKKLACPRNIRKAHSGSPVPPSSLGLVAGQGKCANGSTFTPSSARSLAVYRCLKRRLGRTLRRLHCKRRLVSRGKSSPHKFSRTKSSPASSPTVRASLQRSDCSCCHRQYDSGFMHKQTRGYEVRLSLCPPMETSLLVPSQRHNPLGQAHSGSPKCNSRQTVKTQPSDSDRVVPLSSSVQSVVFHLGSSSGGPIRDPVQPQASQICVSCAGSDGLGSGRPKPVLGTPGRVCLPSSLSAPPGNYQIEGSGLPQDDSHCSRLAEHALVLGSGRPISSDSLQSASDKGPRDTALQRASSQEPPEPQSSCLAPRSSAIRKHGFSQEVAARIEAPQRLSTRAVYKSKWAIFVKWCQSNEVDFRSPSLNQIADFLLYLYKDRNLQPSTIDGYRTAIADMLGNDSLKISSDENLTRLLDSFHRDKPKGRRGVPSWNLSLVLSQLSKAPFEPLRKASLKHLTFKTVFLWP